MPNQKRRGIFWSMRNARPSHQADRLVSVVVTADFSDVSPHRAKTDGSEEFTIEFESIVRTSTRAKSSQPFIFEDDRCRFVSCDTFNGRTLQRCQLFSWFDFSIEFSDVPLITLCRILQESGLCQV